MITVIDVYLSEKGCSISYRNKSVPVHLQQGNLDGACAVYSLMMYLLILKIVNRAQLEDLYGGVKKPDNINNLFKALFENRGLVRDGFDFSHLQTIVNRHISDIVHAESRFEKKDHLKVIKETIDKGEPIMIGIVFRNGAHALLAVGYESDEKNGVFNIFCLDPGFAGPTTSYWNSVILLNETDSTRYPHQWIWNGPQLAPNIDYKYPKVSIDEILRLDKVNS